MTKAPRRAPSAADGKASEPAVEPADVARVIKRALEQEVELKIRYQRSTGEIVNKVIEPESLQGKKLFAFCPDDDEHHVYAVDRIQQASF